MFREDENMEDAEDRAIPDKMDESLGNASPSEVSSSRQVNRQVYQFGVNLNEPKRMPCPQGRASPTNQTGPIRKGPANSTKTRQSRIENTLTPNAKGKRSQGDKEGEPKRQGGPAPVSSTSDWEFDEFEDIAHPPAQAGSRHLEPAWKKPDIGLGVRARAKELTNAFGNAMPAPGGIREGGIPAELRMPPPVPLRDILALGTPTLRHIPGGARPRIQEAFARVLRNFVSHLDTISLWHLMAFPKLILRATGDPKTHPGWDAGNIVLQRLDAWEAGRQKDLWLGAEKEVTKARKQPPRAASLG